MEYNDDHANSNYTSSFGYILFLLYFILKPVYIYWKT